MALKLDALLNPTPSTEPEQRPSQSQPTRSDDAYGSTHEAAEVLATLSHFGRRESAQELSPLATQYPKQRHHSNGSIAAPMEPAAPGHYSQTISPTLEQYHHGSKSPEEQRRLSLATAPGPVLAPIQSMTSPDDNVQLTQRVDAAPHQISQPSPVAPTIKTELSNASGHITRQHLGHHTAETETLKTVNDLQNEHGLRGSPTTTLDMKPTPAPAPSKKRAAPKLVAKKGRAIKPSKKRKIDADGASVNGEDSLRSDMAKSRGGSGKNAKRSHTGTPLAGSSPAPPSHAATSEGEESSGEDDNVYCICKGKDDHTWMVGCDACDDWFHGRCVGLTKGDHEKLLAKFVCPICEEQEKGHTTWKPMCRRDGCNEPAKVTPKVEVINGQPQETMERSKYCSDACGLAFFQNVINHITARPSTPKKKKITSRQKVAAPASTTHDSDDDLAPPPRGGILRPTDLKALVLATPSIADFHALGSGVLSPPTTASPNSPTHPNASLLPTESARLATLAAEKSKLNAHRALLKDRETFILMIRDRAKKHAEEKGVKSVCGWDKRLTWNDAEFDLWRNTPYARASLAERSFEPSAEAIQAAQNTSSAVEAAPPLTNGHTTAHDADGDTTMPTPPSDSMPILPTTEPSMWCQAKSKCPHRGWQSLHLKESRFEEVEALQGLMRIENEEKEVRERAMVRWRREKVGEGLEGMEGGGGVGGESGAAEGWVEVLA